MVPPKYKFYLQINDGDKIAIEPHYKDLKKKLKKESGQEFFRASIDGKINLFGHDYSVVKNATIEDNIAFIIEKYNDEKKCYVDYYKTTFNKSVCKFDELKRKCELKLEVNDEYSNIMNNYENTYDLIELSPGTTEITLNKRPCMQVYVKGSKVITNFNGGISWENDVEVVDDVNELTTKYYFEYNRTAQEIYVSNSSDPDVNGVYAGINIDWRKYINDTEFLKISIIPNGIETYTWYGGPEGDQENVEQIPAYLLVIYKNNVIQYQSPHNVFFTEDLWNGANWSSDILGRAVLSNRDSADNKQIKQCSIQMINRSNANDKCALKVEFLYDIYARLLCDVDTIEGVETYDKPYEDFASNTTNYKKCMPLAFDGDIFKCSSYATDEPTKYGKNDYGKYFSNKQLETSTGYKLYPFGKYSWANVSLWFSYPGMFRYWEMPRTKQYKLKHSYSIAEVIKALLKKVDPNIKHEATEEYSSFLYGYTNLTDRFYMFITPKSNMLKGEYDQQAQRAEITLKDVMDMLRDCYKCYWYIEDNKLKIEHIKFFNNGGTYMDTEQAVQLDYTKLNDKFNKKPVHYLQSEIEYDKSDLASRYEFSWMDESTVLSGDGTYIDVLSNYIQKDLKEEISAKLFSSDVDYMLLNPTAFSNDGFALLCAGESGSEYEIPINDTTLLDENEKPYTASIQNIYASFVQLIKLYMYDMSGDNIKCNVKNLEVEAIKKSMHHDIEVIEPDEIDEMKLIRTNIGNGKIDEMTVNMNTSLAKIKLVYKPE